MERTRASFQPRPKRWLERGPNQDAIRTTLRDAGRLEPDVRHRTLSPRRRHVRFQNGLLRRQQPGPIAIPNAIIPHPNFALPSRRRRPATSSLKRGRRRRQFPAVRFHGPAQHRAHYALPGPESQDPGVGQRGGTEICELDRRQHSSELGDFSSGKLILRFFFKGERKKEGRFVRDVSLEEFIKTKANHPYAINSCGFPKRSTRSTAPASSRRDAND